MNTLISQLNSIPYWPWGFLLTLPVAIVFADMLTFRLIYRLLAYVVWLLLGMLLIWYVVGDPEAPKTGERIEE